MTDPRNTRLAKVFVEHSLNIHSRDHVVLSTSDTYPEDLIGQCFKQSLQKDADVFLDIMGFNFLLDRSSVGNFSQIFYENANDRQIKTPPDIYKHIADWGTKFIRITSIDNYQHLANIDSRKLQSRSKSYQDWFDTIIDKNWVLTYYPTKAMAQKSGMSLSKLFDFYFKSVLIDYDKMKRGQQKLAKRIDNGRTVHIVGENTDLTLGIEGRTAHICAGQRNIPDGEVFTGPVEDKTDGYIYYEFPGTYTDKEISGIYLEFSKGLVTKAKSDANEKALHTILDTDPGAKRLGEFAFGTNYGIKNFMKETLFDEKIGGTIHTALGHSYNDPTGWGKNVSAIHWDLVKDTRSKGSYVEIDGKKILEDGTLLA